MRTRARWAALAALGMSAIAAPLSAQSGYFGQNQVQYDRLKWRVLETDHFQIHYYPAIGLLKDDIAKMAERSYGRLSVLMGHQFREKKPILVYGSSGDFAQSNVFGDLGEGTGGVTDPLRQRMAEFMTGDYASFEHVLQHEMVHVFQFDIFSRGKAGAGIGNLAQVNPPKWFMEGLAEYFSIGQKHPWTDAWIRDAVVNNTLPTIAQMTEDDQKYFAYRFGFSVWQYIGARWGDEVIAEIMNSVPSIGIERSFRRELGVGTVELSAEYKQAMQAKYLPMVASLDRPRSFAEPLLSQHRSGGNLVNLFVAPALNNDATKIMYVAYGSLWKGEVFPDLYLADAKTGKREARLVKSTTNPDFEQLRYIYSQPSFSPDGKTMAFTSQRGGRDIINLMDAKSRKVYKRIDFDIDQVLSPSWSPDGKTIVFTGLKHGVSDLYTVKSDGTGLKQLTNDRYGDMQPQWSPDGKTIAFASDRGPDTDFEILKIGKWKISLFDVETGEVTLLPNQGGLNINPQWAPDGKSIAFVSDRTGISNLFLYDFTNKEHYQLTNVIGAVNAIAEYSPAISWARGADVMAFVYYEKGDHTVWRLANPRGLKKQPYRDNATTVVASGSGTGGAGGIPGSTVAVDPATVNAAGVGFGTAGGTQTAPLPPGSHLPVAGVQDTSANRRSVYRAPMTGNRLSNDLAASTLPKFGSTVSITAMMDSFDFKLPDSTRYKDGRYKVRLTPEYISQPSIGFQAGGYGSGAYGGTTLVLGDLLGDHRLAISGSLNGQLADAFLFVGFENLSKRLQYNAGFVNQPISYLSNQTYEPLNDTQYQEVTDLTRLVIREVYGTALYPLNRFTRFEFGAKFDNIEQQLTQYTRTVDVQYGIGSQYQRLPTHNLASASNIIPFMAWVTDNTLNGIMYSPIMGKRIRLQASPSFGAWKYVDYLVDARNYTPIIFNYLTLATRVTASVASGRDEGRFPKWIGNTNFIRGYNRDLLEGVCSGLPTDNGAGCSQSETIGSRVAFGNVELRFPVLRLRNSSLPIPPIEGLFFYDAGVAWTKGQSVTWNTPASYDVASQRAVLRSYGFGLRANLFNLAILRYDWAVPASRPGAKGFGTFSLGVSY